MEDADWGTRMEMEDSNPLTPGQRAFESDEECEIARKRERKQNG